MAVAVQSDGPERWPPAQDGAEGRGFGKLTRRELTFADQRILHGLRQATEVVGIEEDVGISG